MGSTIQVLFYLAAFSSLKAFFHWDPTCSGNGIPFKIHTSISWQGFPYCFSSSYVCTLSTYQKYSIGGFVLKTDLTRTVLTFFLHKGNKVVKSQSRNSRRQTRLKIYLDATLIPLNRSCSVLTAQVVSTPMSNKY